ncbi:MAG: HRDC domain-containing protein [Candidatus Azotimanducaceae bacterium WSBS_2022_MAG_OTU7]
MILNAFRLDIAGKKNIPAFVIFYDTMLQQMTAKKPMNVGG